MKPQLPRLIIVIVSILFVTSACSPAPAISASGKTETLQLESHAVQQTTAPASETPSIKKTALPSTTPAQKGPATETAQSHPRRTQTTPAPTLTTETKPASPTPTQAPTLGPDGWKDFPIVPVISDEVLKIYARGLELGNNPHAFSKIGDCGSTPAWFLGDFDRGPRYYRLGDDQHLQNVIDYFAGSFDRTSLAARSGFNASALFVPLWTDRSYCESDETPLDCEYRVQKPVIAFIMLGANDVWHPQEFEPQMRKIIEYSIENGVIPILATKADNQEGDGNINATIARLSIEYQIPLWNFWRASYPLPDHGLQEDKVHLSWGPNFFDDPNALNKAWTQRNLTALQVLNAVWQKITLQK